ncbi:MAG: sulfur oxidation c-type cytochrome SoxX [Polynucleobacter sp.]|uniref:Sulfur oxidation c-type cytochrome SoxX n=1 Tax=Polynucleobacter aenigmaticus TaxID=1743164 RepID=A0A254Q363_9BURK|nr:MULTISPECIES: sulfur oxidation c-type cytochrome SoxX [Polynucleobacter]MDO8713972.1 sulfur oxidation c-type cytochrome SoxX [Polynucleobacter sp.]OWS71291.1 sulfur oxidation c-type cytochrome SoxX [Polynucleobacter aenigmaticus]
MRSILVAVLLGMSIVSLANQTQAQTWSGDSIVNPLTSSPGDATKGRMIVASRQTGLCLLCHSGPFPEERFQGNLAPDMGASVGHLSEAQLRARIVDPSRFNAGTIMPSYYRTEGLNRVAPKFEGQSILSGQEIEDVVAFLVSLKVKTVQ